MADDTPDFEAAIASIAKLRHQRDAYHESSFEIPTVDLRRAADDFNKELDVAVVARDRMTKLIKNRDKRNAGMVAQMPNDRRRQS